MNGKELVDWRERVTEDLSSVKTDVKWIKENLRRFSIKQDELETQVSWLKGVGSLVGVVLGSLIAFLTNLIMR